MAQFDINTKWCKGCGICVELCPKKVLTLKNEKAFAEHPEACIVCRMCEFRCPDLAIYVKKEGA
jgi:2-oxoglutarate ferredoxin oxidoreductase subunit delta